MATQRRTKSQLLEEIDQLKASASASDKVLQSIISRLPDIVYRLDKAGKITFISEAVRQYGHTPAELLGRSAVDIVDPAYRDLVRNRINERRTGDRRTKNLEIRIILPDHAPKYFEIRSTIAEDSPNAILEAEGLWEGDHGDESNFIGSQGVIRDITDRKRAEESAEESELRFQTLFETSPDGVLIDQQGNLIYANRAYQEMFGIIDLESCLSKSYLSRVAPEDRKRVEEVSNTRESGEPAPTKYEYTGMREDGSVFPIEVTAAPFHYAGKPATMAILRDISDRKQAENARLESERKYTNLYKKTPVMLHSTDSDGKIVSVSDQWLKVLGYELDEVIGHKSEEFLTPASRKYKQEVVYPGFMREGHVVDVSYQYMKKTGEIVDVIMSSALELDSDGRFVQSHNVLVDVTEQKKLEAQVRQAQKMEAVGRLAGGVAHDFNNLLTAIIGNAELAQMGLSENDPIRKDVDEIILTAERAASLTAQLLAFSRKQVVEIQSIDLNQTIDAMGQMLLRLLTEDIKLSIVLDPKAGLIEADQSQIEQVIVNLAVNAREAMLSGGNLCIQTTQMDLVEAHLEKRDDLAPGTYLKLSVSDSGIGINPEIQAHIFEPFFTTKDTASGTGLGLATTYAIVQKFGGFISVYSEEGLGTTFNVYLPIREDSKPVSKRKSFKVVDRSGTETVLIVEDNESVLTLSERIMNRYGYTVLTAPHANSAVEQFRRHPEIDIIVSDVIMPGQSGPQMIVHLEELGYNNPVIYMSGHNEEIIVERGVLKPGINFISKPFHPQDLARKVREVLDMETA